MNLSPPATADVIAGLSVAVVLIPQAMAYAELAGLPPHVGLFSAAIPLIAAAPFVSSPYLQTGPVALTGLLTFGALAGKAPAFTSEYIELAVLLALHTVFPWGETFGLLPAAAAIALVGFAEPSSTRCDHPLRPHRTLMC